MPPVALTASVVKRERQTGLRLACEALEGERGGSRRANDDGDARAATTRARDANGERGAAGRDCAARGGRWRSWGSGNLETRSIRSRRCTFSRATAAARRRFDARRDATCEEEERRAIEELHAEMTRENKSAVVRMTDGEGRTSGELHLVAVPEATRDGEEDGGEGTGDETAGGRRSGRDDAVCGV